jgi:hypothetical protein
MKKHENMEGRLTRQAREHPGWWRAAASGGAAGGGAAAYAGVRPGSSERRQRRVVQLGLVVNGLAGRENREKLIFSGPFRFRWLVN